MGRKCIVPWTDNSIEFLIKIFGINISSFMSPYSKQSILWAKLVGFMKQNEKLPEKVRETVTALHAQRKWNCLIKQFKVCFYSASEGSSDLTNFVFYEQMNKLFTDYAKQMLESEDNNETLNETSDADISAYVKKLLNNTAESIDSLEVTQVEKENLPQKTSVAAKIVTQLQKMPQSSVNYYQETMRIDPNTPFKRVYGISTILDRRNLKKTPMKRIKSDSSSLPNIGSKKQRVSSVGLKVKKENKSINYKVEALDECIFYEDFNTKKSFGSKTNFNGSQDSTGPIYVSNLSNEVTMLELSDSYSNKNSTADFTIVPKLPGIKRYLPMVKVPQAITISKFQPPRSSMEKTITISVPSPDNSILEVPPLEDTIDDLRGTKLSSTQIITSVTMNGNNSAVSSSSLLVPKKLSFVDDSVSKEKAPEWFSNFIKKYDADVKRVDSKLERIDQKIDQLIGVKKALVSPKVKQLNRNF